METVKFYIFVDKDNTYRIESTENSRYNIFRDKVRPERMILAMEDIADKMRNMYDCDAVFEFTYI